MEGIYDLFLSLVINDAVEVISLKVYFTTQFFKEYLKLFDSVNPVERDFLKNILHRLYGKLVLK